MIPLFRRLKEVLFKHTDRLPKKGFFQGITQSEQEQLKNNGITYIPPQANNVTETEE